MSDSNSNDVCKNNSNEYVEDGANKMIVKCKFCGSKMLDKKAAKYIIDEVIITIHILFQPFSKVCFSTKNFREFVLR